MPCHRGSVVTAAVSRQCNDSSCLAALSGAPDRVLPELVRLGCGQQAEELKAVTDALAGTEIAPMIQIDFSVVNDPAYYNGLITNEEIIKELLEAAEEISKLQQQGKTLGLSSEEMAFYDALTRPEAIKDFYENDVLVALTKELTETLRKNRTIDWEKRDDARAKMRMMIKKLLKKHKYPPEGMEDAVDTVMLQCELWTDNNDMECV